MKRLALALLLVGLCLVVATASALTPTKVGLLPQNEFRALSSSVPGSAGAVGGYSPTVGPQSLSPSSAPPSTRPAPPARPLRTIEPATHSLTGQATWWASWGSGLYAAAGPRLRTAMGPGYLHRYVTACARGVCVRVRLTTSCACQPDTRLIDLSLDAFAKLASPSLGVIPIEVSW